MNTEIVLEEIKSKNLNSNLNKAAKLKDDEFYTQYEDIEKEVKNYKKHFKGKTIYCNCDNPEWSNFYKYFSINFDYLQLKKIITTHYNKEGVSYKLELIKQGEVIKTNLKGNGDFRNKECIEILKESDIVVTNPPFSLFRDYIDLLTNHNKKFLIIGNFNAIKYNNIFKLLLENKIWVGVSPRSMNFILPNGNKKFVNANWYTNLEHKKRNIDIILFKTYNENEYIKYDNYDAINIDKVKDIPINYDKPMGVPITFLEKYNPNQFELIYHYGKASVLGIKKYSRIIIKHKKPQG